jgi:hypothetical protein
MDLLRQLAMEAQEVLRGYESEAPAKDFAPPVMSMPAPLGAAVSFDDAD